MRALGITIAAGVGLARVAAAEVEPYAGVAVEELYDSNVMNSRGPDVVTRVSPRAGVVGVGARGAAGAEYLLALHGYAGGTASSSVNHRAELWGRWRATRRLTLGASLRLVAADDPVLLDRAGVAVPNGGFVDLMAAARAEHRLARRWTLDASYALRSTRFEDDATSFDGDEHRAEVGVTHRATRRLEVGARGRGQRFVDDSDEEALGATATVSWRWSRSLRAHAAAGPIWIDGAGDFTASGRLQFLASRERGSLWVEATRDFHGATGEPGALRADSALVRGAWRIGRRLVGRARAGVYRNVLASTGEAQGSGIVGRAGLGWTSRDGRWRVELHAEHRAQDGAGGLGFDDVQRTLVGIRLSALAGGDPFSIEEER